MTPRHDGEALLETSAGPAGAGGSLELTILMPCLNEAETLAVCIRKARGFLEGHGVDGEILVADNGSTDESRQIAVDEGARVIEVAERGYGAALSAGVAAARGRYVIMGDSDYSYDFSALMPFLSALREGWQLVIGNRFSGGIAPGAMPPLHRYLGNPALSWVANTLFRSPVHDFHCGLRGFETAAMRELRLRTVGMEFASEMIVKATLAGMRITEVPTMLAPDGRSRPPHLRSWRDGWRHLRFMLIYSPTWLFLYPGLLLMTVGLLVIPALATGERTVGDVTFGVHSLLYAALALVVGFESVGFARFLHFIGRRSGELPENRLLSKVEAAATLERSIGAGIVLIALGILGSGYAFDLWYSVGFGGLSPESVMRITIPSVAAFILGVQCALSGFFMYALGHGPGGSG